MKGFRHRFQEKLARLDDHRTRRHVALGAMALFLSLLAGPEVLRVAGTVIETSADGIRRLTLRRAASSVEPEPAPEIAVQPDVSAAPFLTIMAGLAHQESNVISASGTVIGFPVLVADFHVESRTGFDRDFSATRAPDGAWQAVFNVPPGQTYDVRLDAFSRDGRSVSSPTRRVDVSPAANRLEPPAPDVAPTLAILFPAAEAVQDDPFDVSVRIGNATAVGMIFEIKDAAGDLRRLEASPADTAGLWTAPFTAVPGDYDLSVRASLENGFVQNFSEHRAFRILAATGTPANP